LDSGNVLVVPEFDETNPNTASFHKADGEFLRLVTWSEAEYLMPLLPEITFVNEKFPTCQPKEWKFLWSVETNDLRSYKPETACNGGDYAFYQKTSYFVRGKQFMSVTLHTSSADFSYCELDGRFQDTKYVKIIGADIEIDVPASVNYHDVMVLDQVGEHCSLAEVLQATDCTIEDKTTYEPLTPEMVSKRKKLLVETNYPFTWEDYLPKSNGRRGGSERRVLQRTEFPVLPITQEMFDSHENVANGVNIFEITPELNPGYYEIGTDYVHIHGPAESGVIGYCFKF
jgi:hypothetical protein